MNKNAFWKTMQTRDIKRKNITFSKIWHLCKKKGKFLKAQSSALPNIMVGPKIENAKNFKIHVWYLSYQVSEFRSSCSFSIAWADLKASKLCHRKHDMECSLKYTVIFTFTAYALAVPTNWLIFALWCFFGKLWFSPRMTCRISPWNIQSINGNM